MQTKYFIIAGLVIWLITGNCKKEEDKICTIQERSSSKNLVSDTDLTRALELFQKNNITLPDNIRINKISYFSSDTYISCSQFWKGFMIFFQNFDYIFDKQDNLYISPYNKIYQDINIDTIPKISKEDIGMKYYNQVKKDSIYTKYGMIKLDKLKENCVRVELGIWKLDNDTSKRNFVLAWEISPSDALRPVSSVIPPYMPMCPVAYYNAYTGELLNYSDCITLGK